MACSTGSPASLRLTKLMPLTTRPSFTSRHGIIRFANIRGKLQVPNPKFQMTKSLGLLDYGTEDLDKLPGFVQEFGPRLVVIVALDLGKTQPKGALLCLFAAYLQPHGEIFLAERLVCLDLICANR